MNKMLFLDDAPDSKRAIMAKLADILGMKIHICNPPEQSAGWVSQIDAQGGEQIDAIFIDHCLTVNGRGNVGVFRYGASLCGLLREKFCGVPIIGISAADERSIAISERDEYVEFFDMRDIIKCAGVIKSIIDGFGLLRKVKRDGKAKGLPLTRLMKVPSDLVDMVQMVMPIEIGQMDLSRREPVVYKWFKNYFFKYAGLVVDAETISARIGLCPTAFNTVLASKLKKFRYDGIFADVAVTHYWKSEVFAALSDIVKDDGTMLLARYVDRLKVKRDQFASCPICGEKYTEVLAYDELNLSQECRHPAHRKCVEEVNVAIPNMYDPVYVLRGGVAR